MALGAFRDVRGHRPDVLVLDLNMPGGSSIDAITRLAPGIGHAPEPAP
jgi:DNA-binding NarL/FixJ family response regulator